MSRHNTAVLLHLALLLVATASAKPAPKVDSVSEEMPRNAIVPSSDVVPGRMLLSDGMLRLQRRPTRGFDTLTGASFGNEKRGGGFDSINGVSFGGQKRSFESEFNKAALEALYRRSFEDADRPTYESFYKNSDEADRYADFPAAYKRQSLGGGN